MFLRWSPMLGLWASESCGGSSSAWQTQRVPLGPRASSQPDWVPAQARTLRRAVAQARRVAAAVAVAVGGGGGGGGFTEGAGAGSGVGAGAGSGATAGVRAVDTAFVCNLPLIPARAGWARTGRVAAEKEPATMIPSHREIVGLLALRRCDRASVGPNPAPPDGRGTWRRPAYHAGSANTRGRDPRAPARGGSRDR